MKHLMLLFFCFCDNIIYMNSKNIIFNLPQKKLEELGVSVVYLFGSQAEGTAKNSSDFDFGILLKNPKILFDFKERKKIYDNLYDIFSGQIKQLVNIDIVFLQDVYLQLQYHTISRGKIIYEKDPKISADYKEKIIEKYADFAPIRKEFHKAILERI